MEVSSIEKEISKKIDLKALEAIRPVASSFELESTGDFKHTIRKISIDDKAWLRQEENISVEEICADLEKNKIVFYRLVYRLLEDKTIFAKKEVKTINEEGEDSVESIGGLSLFRRMVCSPKEELEVIKAFSKAMGMSEMPAEKAGSEKKKVKVKVK